MTFLKSVDIEPQKPSSVVFLCHTEKFPSVSFIKRRMLCYKIQRIYTPFMHIKANIIQQGAGNSVAAVIFLNIKSANIRGQIFSVMEIIIYNAESTDYLIPVHS